jgi:hypothetical protein
MSWAAFRETTREEDQAYSLLGLFGVNMPLLYGEGGEKAFSRLQQEIMKHSNDDSIFAWIRLEPRNWARILHYKGMHRRGFLAWRPQVFYAGHAIFTAATAKMFEDTRVTEWTSATLAHTSTSYEDKRDFISLNCPVLTLENLPEISKTRIFTACEESVAGSMLESEKVPSYKEFATESVENVLNGRVIAILSCCFVFGRVGIILEERQDGTYSRIHDPSIVGVQVTELPQPKLLKIRHREGAGDACGLRSMSSRCEITGLEVILLEKGGYSIAGRYFKCSEGITHGSWDTTEKGESISFLFPPREGRVALLYRHQGGDSVLNANFVLAFHWSFLTSFGFLGVTVSDNELIDKHWAKNLIWESKWQEPEPAQLSLGETKLVNISMRKAPGIGGRRWYIFLSFDNHNVI